MRAPRGASSDATISKEVDDLGSVVDALAGRAVGYAGHSMGGAVGVLRASRDARIRALVSLAAMVHTRAFVTRTFGELAPGDLMMGKPGCVLSQGYLDDLRAIDSVVGHADEINVPWLFVHGTGDTLVPIGDTQDAYARARITEGARRSRRGGPLFQPGQTGRMVDAVVRFCKAHLVGESGRVR